MTLVLVIILEWLAWGLSRAFLILGISAMVLFGTPAMWLEERADELSGGWRRSRQHNWLSRWASRNRRKG